ncbi:MAG: hypothetical protein KDE19_22125, partial [Caldilineaceae bacterium]|nr:hypothetical protein [Caldilineaceae bacterium]
MAFSQADRQLITTLANEHHLSENAVQTLWHAVVAGNGTAAQFNHPELGGMGQWMAGGMVMVGDFSRSYLQGTVSQICVAIAAHLQQPHTVPAQPMSGGSWQTQSQHQGESTMRTTPAAAAPIHTSETTSSKTAAAKADKGGFFSSIGKLFGNSASSTEPMTPPVSSTPPGSRANWWPDELGSPNSSGSQNDMHYVYFAAARRLALRIGNQVTIYDTG